MLGRLGSRGIQHHENGSHQRAWHSPNHRLHGAICPTITVTGSADGDSRSDADHSPSLGSAASSGTITNHTKERKDQ